MKISLNGKQIWVNYHHLYYFFVVVNEGSLLNASRLLLIGQPSLSSQIKQFELNLGVELFDRTHKRLTLTREGKITHGYAEKIFKMGEEMMSALLPKSVNQEVRIGISENISKNAVLSICKSVMSDPLTSVNISRGNADELIKELNSKKLDYLITNYAPSTMEAPGIMTRKIENSPIVICGKPAFKHLAKGFPESINHAPFMLPLPGSSIRNKLEAYFKKNKVNVKLIGESKDISIQKLITLEGIALIAVPLSSVKEYLDRKELVEIGRPENLMEEVYLLSNNHSPIEIDLRILTQDAFETEVTGAILI